MACQQPYQRIGWTTKTPPPTNKVRFDTTRGNEPVIQGGKIVWSGLRRLYDKERGGPMSPVLRPGDPRYTYATPKRTEKEKLKNMLVLGYEHSSPGFQGQQHGYFDPFEENVWPCPRLFPGFRGKSVVTSPKRSVVTIIQTSPKSVSLIQRGNRSPNIQTSPRTGSTVVVISENPRIEAPLFQEPPPSAVLTEVTPQRALVPVVRPRSPVVPVVRPPSPMVPVVRPPSPMGPVVRPSSPIITEILRDQPPVYVTARELMQIRVGNLPPRLKPLPSIPKPTKVRPHIQKPMVRPKIRIPKPKPPTKQELAYIERMNKARLLKEEKEKLFNRDLPPIPKPTCPKPPPVVQTRQKPPPVLPVGGFGFGSALPRFHEQKVDLSSELQQARIPLEENKCKNKREIAFGTIADRFAPVNPTKYNFPWIAVLEGRAEPVGFSPQRERMLKPKKQKITPQKLDFGDGENICEDLAEPSTDKEVDVCEKVAEPSTDDDDDVCEEVVESSTEDDDDSGCEDEPEPCAEASNRASAETSAPRAANDEGYCEGETSSSDYTSTSETSSAEEDEPEATSSAGNDNCVCDKESTSSDENEDSACEMGSASNDEGESTEEDDSACDVGSTSDSEPEQVRTACVEGDDSASESDSTSTGESACSIQPQCAGNDAEYEEVDPNSVQLYLEDGTLLTSDFKGTFYDPVNNEYYYYE